LLKLQSPRMLSLSEEISSYSFHDQSRKNNVIVQKHLE
jgi:hypothetical protein